MIILQALLNKSHFQTKTTKIADILLNLPRKMWLGRKVTLVESSVSVESVRLKCWNAKYGDVVDAKKSGELISGTVLILSAPIFLLFNAALAIQCAIGLALKKFSHFKNQPEAAVHKIIKLKLREQNLINSLEKTQLKINKLNETTSNKHFNKNVKKINKLTNKHKSIDNKIIELKSTINVRWSELINEH